MGGPDTPRSHEGRAWPGYFIVIEGIDGTGKTTLARGLAASLEAMGHRCLATREPTDGPHGQRLRRLAAEGREGVSAEEEVELFIADRKEHLREVILPALSASKIVICDRYFYSTAAYQGARGADVEAILARHLKFAPLPDLLILLELDVATALARIRSSRGETPDHFEGEAYLERVAALFATIRHPHLLRLDARAPAEELIQHAHTAIGSQITLTQPG